MTQHCKVYYYVLPVFPPIITNKTIMEILKKGTIFSREKHGNVRILSFFDRASPYILTNNPTRCTIRFKYIYLCLSSTCFGHPSAHHQEKITVSMRHCYLSLWMGGVWSAGSRPDATCPELQIPVPHKYSDFLLMMGTWGSQRSRTASRVCTLLTGAY